MNDPTRSTPAASSAPELQTAELTLFMHGPIPMFLMDRATLRFVEVNRAAEELYGYTREEFLAMTAEDIRPPEDVGFLHQQVRGAANPRGVTARHRKKDGTDLWMEVAFAGVTYEGRPARLVVAFDITQRVEATLEVERLRRFYEDILENIDVDIATFDRDLRFEYINQAAIPDPELRAQLIGRTNRDYFLERGKPLAIAEEREAGLRKAVETGERVENVEIIEGRGGTPHYVVRSHLPLFDAHGEVRRVLGYGFDRTEQVLTKEALREKEAQLHRAQRLEATGRLAGGVAHDFNNLLTAMRGHVELLLEDASASDEQLVDLRGIKAAVDQAAKLVEHLLTFGRRNIRAPQPMCLGELVQGRQKVLRQVLPATTDLVVELPPELPRIMADPAEMEQVLFNLVFNGRDAMPAGGTLTVALEVAPARNGDVPRVCLAVEDTGHGMDEETRTRALEPFFTTKDASRGTGLGLSVVYGVVSAAGGDLELASRPGEGTRVVASFPALDA